MASSTCSNAENEKHNDEETEDSDNSDRKSSGGNSSTNSNPSVRPPIIQKGVLRTNCIDCLDRTNVAQYAYGLAALGQQLRALGVISSTKMDLDDPLAEELMGFYERMGDTLAHQYGGSAAHNKVIIVFNYSLHILGFIIPLIVLLRVIHAMVKAYVFNIWLNEVEYYYNLRLSYFNQNEV